MKNGDTARAKDTSNTIGRVPERCSEIMQAPVRWVSENDTVQTAARMMRDADVGFVPVCRNGAVVGIVTDRDIATRACAEDIVASVARVSEVMTHGAFACSPDSPVARAETLMREHRITRIVITDELSRPVGVVGLSDLAQYEAPAKVGRTLQTVAQRKYAPERP
ncbi:MAG TPA: CBS domain-containing protein [Labilithrix sp.]|jgi:CBS domain-containing protein|nr:CBS domain-containing protein [Labilithrix sp.]